VLAGRSHSGLHAVPLVNTITHSGRQFIAEALICARDWLPGKSWPCRCSNHRRAKLLLPVGQAPLQVPAQIEYRLILGDSLQDFECEVLRTVLLPRLLQPGSAVTTHAQGEPQPVPDRFQIRILPNLDLTRRGAAHREDSGRDRAFLVGSDRRLALFLDHDWLLRSSRRLEYYTGKITAMCK
jgi:hypothetical protein